MPGPKSELTGRLEYEFWDHPDANHLVGREHENLTVESAEFVGENGNETLVVDYSIETGAEQ